MTALHHGDNRTVKIGKMIWAVCVMGLAIATPMQSLSAQAETWTLAPADNGAFSVETPCTVSEIAAFAPTANQAFEKLGFTTGSLIACQKGPLLIVAGITEVDDLPEGVRSYFDDLAEGMPNGDGMAGKPSVTTFAGRRAIVNRQEKNGFLAQTTVVELGPKRLVMLMCAFENTNLSLAAQGQTLDRFYASFKVTAQ